MSGVVTATAYVQIRKDGYWSKAVRMTQNKPSVVEPDCLVIKVKFTIPVEWFSVPFIQVALPSPDQNSIEDKVDAEAEVVT